MGGQHKADLLRAIIYVLLGHPETQRWITRCLEWCEQQQYQLISIIREPPDHQRRGLTEAIRMMRDGRADIVVVATPEYLPDYWVPRFEVAQGGEPFALPPADQPPRHRRPRRPR